MVGYEGEKMSKSKGNLVLVSTLREAGVDPMAIRLALLGHHYRERLGVDRRRPRPRAEDLLADVRRAVGAPAGAPTAPLVAAVRAALADDLDAPAAVAAVAAWTAATLDLPPDAPDAGEHGAGDVVRRLLDARLGLLV